MCRCRPGNLRKGSPGSRPAVRTNGVRPRNRPCSLWPMPPAISFRVPMTAVSRAPCPSISVGLPKRRAGIGFRGSASPAKCRWAASRCDRDRCAQGRAWAKPLSLAVATARLPWPPLTPAPTPATSAAPRCPERTPRHGFHSRLCRRSRRRSRCNSLLAFSPWSAAICGPDGSTLPRRRRRPNLPSGRQRRRSSGGSIPDHARRWNCRLSRTMLRPPCSLCGRQWAFTDGRHCCTCMCGQ